MDNTLFKKYRNIGLLAVAILILLILLLGERPRHDEKVAAEKATSVTGTQPVAPVAAARPAKLLANPDAAGSSAKNDTDEQVNVSGLAVMEKDLLDIPGDKPATAAVREFPRYSKEFDPEKIDQINAGLKQAMKLQESDPGRYTTAPLTPGGNLYGLDSSKGTVAVLAKGADKWLKIGHPDNAAPGANGTYMITHTDETNVTIMNTNTTFTWRAELQNGKWNWKLIGGFPDDEWLHE